LAKVIPFTVICWRVALAVCAMAVSLSLCEAAEQMNLRSQLPQAPEIMPRSAWGALPAHMELLQEQKPAEIIIHHTGAMQQAGVTLEAKMRALQGFSMNPGRVGFVAKPAWGDILYHYYIDFSGKIAEGRDISFAADAAGSLDNDDRIQIVLEGDFEREQPTRAQLDALTKLLSWLSAAYDIPPEKITGHGDHEPTGCPGKNLRNYLGDLQKSVSVKLTVGER